MVGFPEPADLEVDFVDRTGDSRPKYVNPYGVANPHPGFGKDPNILNEYGHSKYPKMVYPDGPGTVGKVAQSEAEEAVLMGKAVEPKKEAW